MTRSPKPAPGRCPSCCRSAANWRGTSWPRTGRSGEALVFGTTATTPFPTSTVDRRSKEAFAAAGITDPPTLHTGRHATISRLIHAGLDAKAIQGYAGHSSIATTYDRYGHLFPGSLDTDRQRLDAYMRSQDRGQFRGNFYPRNGGSRRVGTGLDAAQPRQIGSTMRPLPDFES